MGLQLKNNFLLLQEVSDEESEFSAIDRTGKFVVQFDSEEYKKGDVVYIPTFLADRWITIDGVKYQVAETTEVVAHVA